MLINIIVAGFAGVLVPLALERIGADPAVASSVFVTMITDSMGFLAFLGLATGLGLAH
jgi:magnesium transporter